MQDTVLSHLYEQDAFAAIEYLSRQSDPVVVTSLYADLVRHLYWEKKDIARTIVMAQAGIQFGLTSAVALDSEDASKATELRRMAKAMAFNLGAFTWPGWDEPGIAIAEAHLPFGLEGARLNLRLAHELNKGDIPLSRAHWLLGAHALATGEYDTASNHFAEAIRYAEAAEVSAEALLSEGYRCLGRVLANPDDIAERNHLTAIQNRLRESEEGAGLAEQLQTAWKVFATNTTAAPTVRTG